MLGHSQGMGRRPQTAYIEVLGERTPARARSLSMNYYIVKSLTRADKSCIWRALRDMRDEVIERPHAVQDWQLQEDLDYYYTLQDDAVKQVDAIAWMRSKDSELILTEESWYPVLDKLAQRKWEAYRQHGIGTRQFSKWFQVVDKVQERIEYKGTPTKPYYTQKTGA